MPNFNINVAQPLQGLQGVIGEELGRQQQAGWEDEAMGLLESGDMGALAKFSIAHPELGQRVREQAGYKSATTEAIRRDAGRKIMMLPEGGDHTQIITEAAEKIRQAGGTPTEIESLLNKTPEEARRIAEEQVATQWSADWIALDKVRQGRAGAAPYTLGKDQVRIKDGDVVARGPTSITATPKRNTTTVGNKVIDTDTGAVIYDGGDSGINIPKSIIKDLPDEMAARVADVYTAAGGGKDGMKAASEERALVREDMRRDNAYESLAISYPNVTPEEMAQLQTAIDTAPTVEKGMALAEKVRTNQRAAEKAAVMSDRSLDLVTLILDNDELDDVIGSSEGKYGGTEQPSGPVPLIGGFISDKEAEAIADIEEITNILTVPAMDLMTGILSESDLKLLKTISGGAFNRTRGLERFRRDVGQIQRLLNTASIIGKLSPKDREAAVWATNKVNMNKPQAKQIRKNLGL